jgi:hypothetical protein
MAFIRQLARAGGGSVVTSPSSLWADNLSAASARQSLSLLLWLLALLLIPFDVGVRRLIVSRRDLQAILQSVPGFRTPTPALTPAVATLGTIREQRAGGVSGLTRSRRRSLETPASTSTTSSQPAATESGLRIAPTVKRPQKTQPPPASGAKPAAPAPPKDDPSTTNQLLAAKRKRR